MFKTFRLLSVAALLTSGAAVAIACPDVTSQATTGRMILAQQTAPGGTGGAGVGAQTTGPTYPGVVGPTGSRQPDATNPSRSMPSGGGGQDNGAGGGAGGAGGSGGSGGGASR